MAAAPYKFAATAENFMPAVVEASAGRPVLVDFWAPWCGPCQALMPLLERIADDYGGRVLLAKVNTDEEPQLASHFQVRSIPTVMLVRHGVVVEQFVGVQPESTIKAFIDKHLEPAATPPGDESEPVATAPAAERPEVAAMRHLDLRDAQAAAAAIEALAAAAPQHELLKSLRARLAFLEVANSRPNTAALRDTLEADPGDAAARHALAAHYALLGDYGTALAEWLELMRRDRKFGDDAGRRSLLQAFDVLGEQDPLVIQYRRRVASLLH